MSPRISAISGPPHPRCRRVRIIKGLAFKSDARVGEDDLLPLTASMSLDAGRQGPGSACVSSQLKGVRLIRAGSELPAPASWALAKPITSFPKLLPVPPPGCLVQFRPPFRRVEQHGIGASPVAA